MAKRTNRDCWFIIGLLAVYEAITNILFVDLLGSVVGDLDIWSVAPTPRPFEASSVSGPAELLV
jgi:hypothetical protein